MYVCVGKKNTHIYSCLMRIDRENDKRKRKFKSYTNTIRRKYLLAQKKTSFF